MNLFKQKNKLVALITTVQLIMATSLSVTFVSATPVQAQILGQSALFNHNTITTTAETTTRNFSTISSAILYDDTPDDIPAAPQPDKTVKTVITVYTSTPDQTDSTPCITADGTDLCKRGTEDVVAANWLPFGTKVKIPSLYGDRVFEVHDRMNARYGYGRMDIWLNTSKTEARKFGVKRVDVEIYYVKKDTELARR